MKFQLRQIQNVQDAIWPSIALTIVYRVLTLMLWELASGATNGTDNIIYEVPFLVIFFWLGWRLAQVQTSRPAAAIGYSLCLLTIDAVILAIYLKSVFSLGQGVVGVQFSQVLGGIMVSTLIIAVPIAAVSVIGFYLRRKAVRAAPASSG